MTIRRVAAVIIALALAGCDGGQPTAQPASPGLNASRSPSLAAPSPTAGPAKLGTEYPVTAGSSEEPITAAVTAFAYRQPTAKSAPKPANPNQEWASVDAQVCIKTVVGDAPTVSNTSWLLIYADGTSAEPSPLGLTQFDSPGYPMGERSVPAGRCVRGWITFTAPKGKRATLVEYQRGDGKVLDWATV